MSILRLSNADLNTKFSFSKISSLTKSIEHSMPYNLPKNVGRGKKMDFWLF